MPDAIEGMEWILVDGIKVARPRLRLTPDEPLTDADIAQMIACPTCRAKVCEPCHTATGNSTEHRLRLIPRRCRCGGLLAPGRRRYCDPCAELARRQTYYRREITTPTRLRRRMRVA